MEIKHIILLFIILFTASSPASSRHVNKNIVSVHVQKKSRDEGIIHHRKFSHALGGGHGGGVGESVNGGQSNSPNTQGSGTGSVIPVYAAGAAAGARNNHHRNSATCSHHCTGFPTLVVGVLVYMFVHISFVLEF